MQAGRVDVRLPMAASPSQRASADAPQPGVVAAEPGSTTDIDGPRLRGTLSVMDMPSAAVVREWARSRGLVVGDRGRLAPQLFEAYAADVLAATTGDRTDADAPAVPTASPLVTVAPMDAPDARLGRRTVRAKTPWNWPQLQAGGSGRP